MSDKGSVFSKGGGGTNFEQYIQTAFLTTLIIHGNAPCLPVNEIIEIAFQSTNKGYKTDDLFVLAKSSIGEHKLLVQIKHNIIISENDETFKEVINAFWTDYNNESLFNKTNDKLLLVKSILTKLEKNNLITVLNWAKSHSTTSDFLSEINRETSKTNVFNLFHKLLKEANNNVSITDENVWQFMKCLNILEYDFLNNGSIDEVYFLNLIKLSKNSIATANEKEIWNSIFAYISKLNKDGGSVTHASIAKEINCYFDTDKLTPYFKSVRKLRSDSEIILKPLKNTISGFHIDRKQAKKSIIDSISNFPFTIVTGKPGVGKSAMVKDVLSSDFVSASVFVFRADQFNNSILSNVFSNQGINDAIQDVFSCLAIIPEKIIVIDSLEKLLEGEPENAFKQLLAVLKDFPDIRLIGTARKHSVDLIIQKYGIPKEEISVIEINPLSEVELISISEKFPQLKGVLENKKIKRLLDSPKYLDFVIASLGIANEDFSSISITEFKDKLWNSLVKNNTNRAQGMPAKREAAFLNIAINRAKEMKLFTQPTGVDEEAVVLLENDEIIFQENQRGKYSPSHDILEDWALVKYVASAFEKNPTSKKLFESLGNEPAIRRAFRLWIEDQLTDQSEAINTLIKDAISDKDITRYWADEILVAIFKADSCKSFFDSFEKELLAVNSIFLNRCLHLIRTSCKENGTSSSQMNLLLPIGAGWKEAILFLHKHINSLDSVRSTTINFLSDWEYKLLFQQFEKEEAVCVKEIVIYYIAQIEKGDAFWQIEQMEKKALGLVKLLFNLAMVSKDEVKKLIENALTNKEKRSYSKLDDFYKNVITICLNGTATYRLAKAAPEIIIDTANKVWKLKPRNIKELKSQGYPFDRHILNDEECWGIADKFAFYPSGVYKTAVYNILFYHPVRGLNFVLDFLNYSLDHYSTAECQYKHPLNKIEIELTDGTPRSLWANWELWGAYRGASVTNYGMECFLMSLEKYLLETAALKTEISRINIKWMFNHLLKNTNNVGIVSVLASVAIAYPEEIAEEMIPILSVREFYEWDLSRRLQESSGGSLAPYDEKIPFAQEERSKSNSFPHRTKYQNGLAGFVIDYQFNIRTINDKIHLVIDKLKAKVKKKDIIWKKTLSDIDIRTYKIEDYDKEIGGHPVVAQYEEDVEKFLSSNNDNNSAQQKALHFSSMVWKAYDGKEKIDYKTWQICYKYYSESEAIDMTWGRPISCAVIGLRDYLKDLTKSELQWCSKYLMTSLSAINNDTRSRFNGLSGAYNIMEKQVALNSFHLIFNALKKETEKSQLLETIMFTLSLPFPKHESEKITEYFRTTFSLNCPAELFKIWNCLIAFSKYKKENHYYYDDGSKEALIKKNKEQKFIGSLLKTPRQVIDMNEITFDKYEISILLSAFMVVPFDSMEKKYYSFIFKMLPLITEDLKEKVDYSHSSQKRGRKIHHEEKFAVEKYLSDFLLFGKPENSNKILDLILTAAYSETLKVGVRNDSDVFEFASRIPRDTISRIDRLTFNSQDDHLNGKLISNFWKVWEFYFEKIKTSGKPYFKSSLFLNIDWNEDAIFWKPLKDKKVFYFKMVKEQGSGNIGGIINVFSTIGDSIFLPDGLNLVVDHLKSHNEEMNSLLNNASERLIKRLFYNHIPTIKSNKVLIENYLWLLDNMFDMGSSQAYMFRENVITYKHT